MPLAHMLAPQIAQKAKQIEAGLGRTPASDEPQVDAWVAKRHAEYAAGGATPEQTASWDEYNRKRYTSFLQQRQEREQAKQAVSKTERSGLARGEGQTFIDNKSGASDAPLYDPHEPEGAYIQAYSTLPKGYEAMRAGMMRGTTVPTVSAKPDKRAMSAKPDTATITKNAKGQLVLNAAPGEAAGTKERGGAVDARGKSVGYLNKDVRTLERRPSDVRMRGTKDAPTRLEDAFSGSVRGEAFDKAQKKYAMEFSDYKKNGYRWPKGYFEGVKSADAKRMRQSVEDMAAFETDINTQTRKPNTF